MNTMTKNEMIEFIRENPNVKITHWLFSSNEYIYSTEDGSVFDENGSLIGNLNSLNNFGCHKGIWDNGWRVKS